MPEHRRVRLAFIEKYGFDMYLTYVLGSISNQFPDYCIFEIYSPERYKRGNKLRFKTIRRNFYRNRTVFLMRKTFELFPDRAALRSHMMDHRHFFYRVPPEKEEPTVLKKERTSFYFPEND